ncbi:PucR family transcriptional regulator ligand-binding domain-containing protein [Streptomyces sp. NPDC047981]|uniref:helix-turn-helix domain-containing protein n=1 Tax=Streptomyces sp. NPDC047981 TaxID=3154610 RepID=UPI003441B39F
MRLTADRAKLVIMHLRLRELLDVDELGLGLVVGGGGGGGDGAEGEAGDEGERDVDTDTDTDTDTDIDTDSGLLDRAVTAVPTIDLADPGRFLSGGELVLTGLAWWHEDGDADGYVRVLVGAGVAALAAGEVEHGRVPDDLVRACRRYGLPLFAVRPETSFATITEYVLRRLRRLRGQDFDGLAALVERHRQLLADEDAPGSGLELLRHGLGVDLRVLSATGRQIAGVQPPLRGRTAAALAARYLAARRAREEAPYRFTVGNGHYLLSPVRFATDASPASELGDWLLVTAADPAPGPRPAPAPEPTADTTPRPKADTAQAPRPTADTSPEPTPATAPGPTRGAATAQRPTADAELLRRAVELVTDARAAHERSKAALHDLAVRLLDLMRRRIPPEEIPVRLRSTAQGVVSQVDTWPRCQFVVAEGTWHEGRPIPAEALRVLLEEALLQPNGPVVVTPQDIASATESDQAVLLALVPTDSLDLPALQRRLATALSRWLGPTDSVSIGAGTPVAEPGNAQRTLDEARTALRVAQDGPERVTVHGPDDLTEHVLSLLPLIPPATRQAFASRLLTPLREHDRRHRTDLLTTLETFLACDASWTTCAARLHLHVNSLRHRITRIEEITGRDLTRLETKLDFLAALKSF